MTTIDSQSPFRIQTERDPLPTLRYPRPIDVVRLQTTVSTVFTAESEIDFQIEHLVASNVTGVADSVTLYLVPNGGTAGATNLIVLEKAVPANDWVTVFDRENVGLLQPGATLQALCGTNDAVNLWGHGFDYIGQYAA